MEVVVECTRHSFKRKGVWKILEYFMKFKSKQYEMKVRVQPGGITSNAT